MKLKFKSGFILAGMPWAILLGILFIWFAFAGDYILFFQEKSSLFITSGEYFNEKFWQPGGFLVCLSGLLTSLYFYPVPGSLVISGTIALISYLTYRSIFLMTGKSERFYPAIIFLMLFLINTWYTFFLINTLGLLLQVLAFMLLMKTRNFFSGWLFVIIAPVWYFLTGGFCWILIFMYTMQMLLSGKGSLLKVTLAWIALLMSWFIFYKFIFFDSLLNLMFQPLTLQVKGPTGILFLMIIILMIFLPLVARIRIPLPGLRDMGDTSKKIIGYALMFGLIVMACVFKYDKKMKQYCTVEKLFYERKFNDIIAYNLKNPSTNSLTLFYNNIALAEEGELNDMMFSFHQSNDGRTLFLKWEMVTEILKRGGYFYYTTGMINEANRWAFENMVMTGHTPEGLTMLIKTELIGGKYAMASKYISLLKKTIFYRREAVRFEKFLFNDAAVESDKELGAKRRTRLKPDFFTITDDPFINVERINITDSLNRKAFEYFIAYLLLKKDYNNLSSSLSRFDELGYTRLPSHVEEAVLAISTMNNGVNPYNGKLSISGKTADRWTKFLTVFQQYGNNLQAAEPALRKQFGNTYWYWIFYR